MAKDNRDMAVEEFNQEQFSSILGTEIRAVESLGSFLVLIENKVADMYMVKFPKKCTACEIVYETREDFVKATNKLQRTFMYEERIGKLLEYRNCTCGNTLVVMTEDRRDHSPEGKALRDLFDACVSKISSSGLKSREEAQDLVRAIFKSVSENAMKKSG